MVRTASCLLPQSRFHQNWKCRLHAQQQLNGLGRLLPFSGPGHREDRLWVTSFSSRYSCLLSFQFFKNFIFPFCSACYYLQAWGNFEPSFLPCEKMFLLLCSLQGCVADTCCCGFKRLKLSGVQWTLWEECSAGSEGSPTALGSARLPARLALCVYWVCL